MEKSRKGRALDLKDPNTQIVRRKTNKLQKILLCREIPPWIGEHSLRFSRDLRHIVG
jgi:hypothetical protein